MRVDRVIETSTEEIPDSVVINGQTVEVDESDIYEYRYEYRWEAPDTKYGSVFENVATIYVCTDQYTCVSVDIKDYSKQIDHQYSIFNEDVDDNEKFSDIIAMAVKILNEYLSCIIR